jgi:hypothetical protein
MLCHAMPCCAVQDLHGMCRFLHLEPLDDRALFVRTLERPVKQRDPLGLKRLQVRRAGQRAAVSWHSPQPTHSL